MKLLTQGLTIAAVLGMSGFAQAAYIDSVSNGNSPGAVSEQTVPGDNDYATRIEGTWTADAPLYSVGDSVDFGHNLVSTSADKFKLTFTYLGNEAGWTNKFFYGATEVFNTGTTAVDSEYSVIVGGGVGDLLDFSFVNGAMVPKTVANDATNGSMGYNFNLFYVAEDEYLISFDDGHPIDDNHDDLVVHVKASKVPEPGTLALLGLGLAGFALRRKTKA